MQVFIFVFSDVCHLIYPWLGSLCPNNKEHWCTVVNTEGSPWPFTCWEYGFLLFGWWVGEVFIVLFTNANFNNVPVLKAKCACNVEWNSLELSCEFETLFASHISRKNLIRLHDLWLLENIFWNLQLQAQLFGLDY